MLHYPDGGGIWHLSPEATFCLGLGGWIDCFLVLYRMDSYLGSYPSELKYPEILIERWHMGVCIGRSNYTI
jgi:hypothetical protein